MGLGYELDRAYVDTKLMAILAEKYGPAHTIDILQECIKLLKPHAKKQEEVTHA